MDLVIIKSAAESPKTRELRALFRAIEKKARASGDLSLLVALDRLSEFRDDTDQPAALEELARIADVLEGNR